MSRARRILPLVAALLLSATTGAAPVDDERDAIVLAVEDAVRTATPYPADWVRVLDVRRPSRVRVPTGARLEVRFRPGQRFLGPVPAEVSVFRKHRLRKRFWATAQVEVQAPTVVVARDLPRGAVIGKGDVRVEPRDLAALPPGSLRGESAYRIRGMMLRVPLAAGRPLTARLLEHKPVVKRGDPVQIIARGQGIHIQASGFVRAEGRVGDVVPVVNASSRRECLGRVIDRNRVEVRF